jgi:signal transduction histidine kinase
MIGYSELMASDVAGTNEAERKKFLSVVVSNGRHLEQLIDGILDLSKVEAGKMDFLPESVDLAELIEDLTTDLRVLAETKQIELVAEVAPEVRLVTTDSTRLKQVAFNYLSNALKFTPEGGRIEVSFVPEDGDCFRLTVEDNGIGIKREDQEKLFQHFQQVNLSSQKMHQGTGLGLSLVKRIVEAQGGKVGLRSEWGKGSAFYAVLPRSAKKAHSASVPAQDAETESADVPSLR